MYNCVDETWGTRTAQSWPAVITTPLNKNVTWDSGTVIKQCVFSCTFMYCYHSYTFLWKNSLHKHSLFQSISLFTSEKNVAVFKSWTENDGKKKRTNWVTLSQFSCSQHALIVYIERSGIKLNTKHFKLSTHQSSGLNRGPCHREAATLPTVLLGHTFITIVISSSLRQHPHRSRSFYVTWSWLELYII